MKAKREYTIRAAHDSSAIHAMKQHDRHLGRPGMDRTPILARIDYQIGIKSLTTPFLPHIPTNR